MNGTLAKAEKDHEQISDIFQVRHICLQGPDVLVLSRKSGAASILRMSDTLEASDSSPEPSARRPPPAFDRRSLSQAITAIIAVTALGLAGWALLRTNSSDEPSYSDTQQAEAKTKACAAFDVVRRGVKVNTSIPVPGGPEDVLGGLVIGANARSSAYVGGLYLKDQLAPATPADLADQVNEFADLITSIGANATAGASDADPEQTARLKAADAANTKLGELCK